MSAPDWSPESSSKFSRNGGRASAETKKSRVRASFNEGGSKELESYKCPSHQRHRSSRKVSKQMKRKMKLEGSLLWKKSHLQSLPFLCWIYARCRISFRRFREFVNGSNRAHKVNRKNHLNNKEITQNITIYGNSFKLTYITND
jgi:hypothetical protein